MGRGNGQRLTRAVIAAVALCAVTSGGGTAVAADVVLAKVPVPDAQRPVGEVRLLQRGDATIVQTLLVTRLLPRVTAEIRLKEERNWPSDAAGHEDMLAYVAALNAAEEQLRASLPPADARNVGDVDRRLRLLVEFSASAVDAGVEISEFASTAEDRPYEVARRRTIAMPAVGRAYVLRNMRLILADSFHLPEANVDQLGPLGPAAAER
jgi:hypothetical protein